MGDTSINTREETPNTANAEINAPAATSIEILRESKPSENISIDSPTTNEDVEKSELDPTPVAEKPSNIETVFEKIDINDKSDSNSDSTAGAEGEKEVVSKPEVDLPPLNFDIKEKPPARNKSDIFSQDDKIQSSNTIFSVKGTPSGRINRRREMSSTVFPVGCMGCKEDAPGDALSSPRRFVDAKEAADDPIGHISDTPRKRASSSGHVETNRNPVTGMGVSSNDEIRKTCSERKKDGNPVLGLGYKIEDTPSTHRVPPGGYSKGLW